MRIKNDYDNCLTNLACSIRRFFGLSLPHATLRDIDALLDGCDPQNIVVILCDGMGSNLIDDLLPAGSFLVRHRLRAITSVFPATTVAATTSAMTGLNPCETGMLGWNMWYAGIGKEVVVFQDCLQSDPSGTPVPEIAEYARRHMRIPLVTDEVEASGRARGHYVSPFGGDRYAYGDIEQMFEIIEARCSEPGRKYVYAYYNDPDSTMHMRGSRSPEAREVVRDIDRRIEHLASRLRNAVVIVTADHGHHDVRSIRVGDVPGLRGCLLRDMTLEPRAATFFVRPGKEREFEQLFLRHLGEDFMLLGKEEVISSGLFGDGEENPLFREALGDYLAVATGDKALLNPYDRVLASHHAGYTDDEVLVPLIAVAVPG